MDKRLPKLSAKGKILLENILILAGIIIMLFFWDLILFYPLKLLTVLIHEISHGIAAQMTGGKISEIALSKNIGGYCITIGGNQIIIFLAGYFGSILTGLLIFYFSEKPKLSKYFFNFLSLILILYSLIFIQSTASILISTSIIFILLILPQYIIKNISTMIYKLLAVLTTSYVIIDIKNDLFYSHNLLNDYDNLEILTGIKSYIWAVIFLGLALFSLYLIIKKQIK